MNSASISDLIIDIFIPMAAVTSPLSLSSDRTCHVIDTLVIIDDPRWYCYRFFSAVQKFTISGYRAMESITSRIQAMYQYRASLTMVRLGMPAR